MSGPSDVYLDSPVLRVHWLTFGRAADGPVMGCHCGFRADLESDCGWGDSVVAHIVAAALPIERAAWGEEIAGAIEAERRYDAKLWPECDIQDADNALLDRVAAIARAAARRGGETDGH